MGSNINEAHKTKVRSLTIDEKEKEENTAPWGGGTGKERPVRRGDTASNVGVTFTCVACMWWVFRRDRKEGGVGPLMSFS